ncbi:MAG: hypothetical protein H8E35_07930 [Ardenticatenia bacterium]|nr:hypothetical protein [Ardenticatenia bacterium]
MNGDFGGETHLLISAEYFREFVKPSCREIVAYVHGEGLQIIKHTDGNVRPLLDVLIEVEFDPLHPHLLPQPIPSRGWASLFG